MHVLHSVCTVVCTVESYEREQEMPVCKVVGGTVCSCLCDAGGWRSPRKTTEGVRKTGFAGKVWILGGELRRWPGNGGWKSAVCKVC